MLSCFIGPFRLFFFQIIWRIFFLLGVCFFDHSNVRCVFLVVLFVSCVIYFFSFLSYVFSLCSLVLSLSQDSRCRFWLVCSFVFSFLFKVCVFFVCLYDFFF